MTGKRLVVRWCAGLLLGTLIIGITSPLFVRSYLPEQLDALRQSYLPAPGHQYRWRSEGYATTGIGMHGMPGRSEVPAARPGSIRVALWGDSQAEGVVVRDSQKLFVQIEREAKSSGDSVQVLPFARSGENASHWLTQIPKVETELDIDVHLLMIVELSDLRAANDAPLPTPMYARENNWHSRIAAAVPGFLIQTVRHLATDQEGNRRQLRFSVGPVRQREAAFVGRDAPLEVDHSATLWHDTMQTIRNISERPIVILYAPRSPHIFDGKIVLHDWQDEQFQSMERAAIEAGLLVIDARGVLGDAARQGRWPHGFHNGEIGNGHLNAVGYQAIAEKVAAVL